MLLNEIKLLNENLQLPPGAEELIHQHCQPYLQAVGNDLTKFMYRGVSKKAIPRAKPTNTNGVFITAGSYQNRKTTTTEPVVHDLANQFFVKKFGTPFRNGIFATGDKMFAGEYGRQVVIIIPIGEFKFCWSPVTDDMVMILPAKSTSPDFDDSLQYFYKSLDEYQDTDLKAAIASTHEIMLYCNECLMIQTGVKSWNV